MDRAYWMKVLQEAERELNAARGRTAINAAARRLQRARAELKRLEVEERLKRRPTSRARDHASS